MAKQYVNCDQFRELAQKAKDGNVDLLKEHDGNLVVLAPQVPQVRALGGHDSRLVEFIITDESVDRYSDTIKVDGWETEDYEANPVVLWAHSHYDPPVGKAITLDLDKKKKQVRSITEFTPRDLSAFGYMVYQMYVQRYLHAVSVGFLPKEYTWVSHDTDAERARKGGIDFLKQSLLEYSAVPVPANPNALAVARSAGIDTAPLKAWAEQVLDESSSRNLSDDARRRMEVLRTAAAPSGRALIIEVGELKEMSVKDKTSDTPPAPPSPAPAATDVEVKRVELVRWECGESGHSHESEDEAKECKRFDVIAAGVATAATGLGTMLKAGRVLSKKNEEALRAAVEALNGVLAQLDKEEPTEDDKSKTGETAAVEFDGSDDDAGERAADDDLLCGLSIEQLNNAIASAADKAVMQLTGRVD